MGRRKQNDSNFVKEVVDNSVSEKIIAKDYEGLKNLISQCKNLNHKNSKGHLPLEVALLNTDFKAATMLIEGGVDINTTNKLGLTFLHIVIRQVEEYVKLGRSQDDVLSIAKKIILKGVDLSLQERRGNTSINSISQLAKANRPNTEIYTKLAKLFLILDKNVSDTIQIKNNMGKSPMDYLARNGNFVLREAIYAKLPSVQNKITEELKQKDLEIQKLMALDKELVK